MKLRTVAREQDPSDILTTCVKTETLLRHIHRINMLTARDGVSKIAPIFTGCVLIVLSVRAKHRRVRPRASCAGTAVM